LHLVDENPAVKVLFNNEFFVFITIHASCIKLWDAHNGSLVTVLRDLTKGKIVRGTMDHRQRKIILGDSNGRVSSFNLNNGAEMKKFKEHDQDVSDLQYVGDTKSLITCGFDGNIFISDDNAPTREAKLIFKNKTEDKKENIRPFNCLDVLRCKFQTKNKMTGANQDISVNIVAIGNSEGKISLIDLSN